MHLNAKMIDFKGFLILPLAKMTSKAGGVKKNDKFFLFTLSKSIIVKFRIYKARKEKKELTVVGINSNVT